MTKRWRIVEVQDGTDADLDSAELVGVSLLLTHHCGEPLDERYNVYWRARQKIQSAVTDALDDINQ